MIYRKEGVTEQLKVAQQMKWAQKMNSVQNQVIDIINSELISA